MPDKTGQVDSVRTAPHNGVARSLAHAKLVSTFGRPNGATKDHSTKAEVAQGGGVHQRANGKGWTDFDDSASTTVIEIGDDGTATTLSGPGNRTGDASRDRGRELFTAPSTVHDEPPAALEHLKERWRSSAFLSGSHPSEGRVVRPHPPTVSRDGSGLPHLPALDGLRGLAVIGVVVFHGGFAWASGGFLGVSTFFTLSGFLITALLLREHTTTGHVALGAFWIRRARRLLPAALASLLLAQVITLALGDAGQRRGLGLDTLGALLYGANWRSVLAGQSYGALFEAPSPLLHFWSLAVEEQFYLFYPLVVFGVLGVLKWDRRRLVALLSTLVAMSVALMVLVGPALGWSIDRLYYGTDTRMAELLAGALLAAVVSGRIGQGGLRAGRAAGLGIALAGAVCLVFVIATWNLASHESAWLYHGGLAIYALATVGVVAACLVPSGPVRSLLAVGPLQWIGRISYGLYLYHWPVFLLMSPSRTGLDDWPLFISRMAVTVPIAMASYRWLEMPFRRGSALRTIRVQRVAPFVVGSLLMVGFVVASIAPEKANDFAASQRRFEEARQRATATTAPAAGVPGADGVLAGRIPRLALFGDSTALATGIGLGDHYTGTGQAEPVGAATELGCGIGRGGERRTGSSVVELQDRCNQWETTWPETLRVTGADLAVVQVGPWDVKERRLSGDDTWRTVGDPVYDAFLVKEMTTAVDVLSASGARVIWLTTPPVADAARATGQAEWREPPPPERVAQFNAMVQRLPELRPGKVTVVDFAGWLEASGRDPVLRPDGVHLSDTAAREVASDYLAQAVLDADASLDAKP